MKAGFAIKNFILKFHKQIIVSFVFLSIVIGALTIPSILHSNYIGTYYPEETQRSEISSFTLYGNGEATIVLENDKYKGKWFVSILGDNYEKSSYNIRWKKGTKQFWIVEKGKLRDQSTDIIFK